MKSSKNVFPLLLKPPPTPQIQPLTGQQHNTNKLIPLTHALLCMTTWVIEFLSNVEQAFGETV